VIIVGTKREAQEIVKEIATATNALRYFGWVGGTLTNFSAFRKPSKVQKRLAMEADGSMTSSQQGSLAIRAKWPVKALFRRTDGAQYAPGRFIAWMCLKKDAVAEAKTMRLHGVAIVDTNSDPNRYAYPFRAMTMRSNPSVVDGGNQSGLDSGLERRACAV
jgi:ribosomal protein S2